MGLLELFERLAAISAMGNDEDFESKEDNTIIDE